MNIQYHFFIRLLNNWSNFLLRRLERKTSYENLSYPRKTILCRNIVLKNRHKDQSTFVIVNGPSLKKQNLSLLKNEVTFAVNSFWKHSIVKDWQPTYLCASDPDIFQDDSKIDKFWCDLKITIPNSTILTILDFGYDYFFKKFPECIDNTFFIAQYGCPDNNLDLCKTVQGFQSVSAFALANAIYMGCNPIYLLGYDHDFLADVGVAKHFYSGTTFGFAYESQNQSDYSSYLDEINSVKLLYENYYALKEIADKRGIKIYNATEGGYLDVFPRVKYESIFRKT